MPKRTTRTTRTRRTAATEAATVVVAAAAKSSPGLKKPEVVLKSSKKRSVAKRRRRSRRSRKQSGGGSMKDLKFNYDDFNRYRGNFGDSNILGSYNPNTSYQNYLDFMNGKTTLLSESYSSPFNTSMIDANSSQPNYSSGLISQTLGSRMVDDMTIYDDKPKIPMSSKIPELPW